MWLFSFYNLVHSFAPDIPVVRRGGVATAMVVVDLVCPSLLSMSPEVGNTTAPAADTPAAWTEPFARLERFLSFVSSIVAKEELFERVSVAKGGAPDGV